MTARIFTVDEANRMLPLVAAIVAEARERALTVRRIVDARRASDGSDPKVPPLDDLPEKAMRPLWDLRRCSAELERLGCYLREPEAGTVEWCAEMMGDLGFLSWRPGEPTVRYWRGAEAKAGEREPLPPPVLRAATAATALKTRPTRR
jgi:hypothetical protein